MPKTAKPKQTNPILRVNLLHPQGEQLRLPGKFVSWLFGYGRFIIIIVEIVVIVCFLVRFKLDADLQEINKQINREADNIKTHSSDEILIKQTQQKLQVIQQNYSSTPDWKDLFNAITSKTPTGVIFSNLALNHTQNSKAAMFKIAAKAKTGADIAAFLNALREGDKKEEEKKFRDVNISTLGFEQGEINFTISGSTK